MNKFDPTKPVQTRDGRKARIVDTNYKCSQSSGWSDYTIRTILCVSERTDGRGETFGTRRIDGKCLSDGESSDDLVNILVKHVRYVNIYPGVILGQPYKTQEETNNAPNAHNRIARVKLEFEEGQFDD